MGAFHAYDIRGIYNADFDKDTAYKVGYFLPELLETGKVLVGRDCRVSSPEIHEYLIKGITDAGADVHDIGLSTTPMVYFGTANYGFKASVQITASHNPAEYNGMKVSMENALPVGLDNGLGQIKAWIDEGRECIPAAVRGSVHQMDIRKDYLDFLLKFKGDYSGLKLAFDLSNGMSTMFAKAIFGDGPAYIFDEMDGRFPNHEPNPLVQKNVQPLKELVKKTGADITIATTGLAGPGGGTKDKKPGLVYISCTLHGKTTVQRHQLNGNRDKVRHTAVVRALTLMRHTIIHEYE